MANWIEEHIVRAGYKRTPSRKAIFSYIVKKEGLFSAMDMLEAKPSLDKVSVYRTLELLVSLDLIRPVRLLNDQQMYEVHRHESHHHHAVCSLCHKQACVPCDVPKKNVPGFTQVHHDVSFTGICENCIP